MKVQTYVKDPLNEQATVLTDAQTDIKTAIKQGGLNGVRNEEVKKKIVKIIDRAIARIRSPTLKEDGRISLMRFADSAYKHFVAELQLSPITISSVAVLMRAITSKPQTYGTYKPLNGLERAAAEKLAESEGLSYTAYNSGIPLQEFQKNYIDRVDKALKNLAESFALDPNNVSGRNSLRNLAEMQVRYERHQDEIQSFKESKVKLVVCSVHADCSDRCKDWQGGVFSLDGTEGYTEDGRHYQPLENATDIYFTTKAGRTYKNGLLGFNCRHKLYEYKTGAVIPTVSSEEQKREYAVTQRQRALERDVIAARENSITFKDADEKKHRYWKQEAKRRFRLYKAYSNEMGRAYYPDRIKIL